MDASERPDFLQICYVTIWRHASAQLDFVFLSLLRHDLFVEKNPNKSYTQQTRHVQTRRVRTKCYITERVMLRIHNTTGTGFI